MGNGGSTKQLGGSRDPPSYCRSFVDAYHAALVDPDNALAIPMAKIRLQGVSATTPFCGKSCARPAPPARQMACGVGPKTPHSPRTSSLRPEAMRRRVGGPATFQRELCLRQWDGESAPCGDQQGGCHEHATPTTTAVRVGGWNRSGSSPGVP
jgi:hypothetical protein